MDIILKSGYVVKNVEPTNGTKSVIGLWVWATSQARDQILTFKGVTVITSEIAAITNYDTDEYPEYDARAEQEIDITDDDLPF
jgi:hypothetical protein